jgi:hypothetical protein
MSNARLSAGTALFAPTGTAFAQPGHMTATSAAPDVAVPNRDSLRTSVTRSQHLVDPMSQNPNRIPAAQGPVVMSRSIDSWFGSMQDRLTRAQARILGWRLHRTASRSPLGQGADVSCAPGRAPQHGKTAMTRGNGETVVVGGCWPLSARKQ